MADGTGTTQYQYHSIGSLGALQLSQESGPLPADTLTYIYDALGRLSKRSVSGNSESFPTTN